MEKRLSLDDHITLAGIMSLASMFETPQMRPAKVWSWNEPDKCDYPRPESLKDKKRANRKKKQSRKLKRGF